MRLKIILLADLDKYLPNCERAGNSCFLDLNGGATVKELMSMLAIPIEIPKVIMINDRYGNLEDNLRDGDKITIFPPICGG